MHSIIRYCVLQCELFLLVNCFTLCFCLGFLFVCLFCLFVCLIYSFVWSLVTPFSNHKVYILLIFIVNLNWLAYSCSMVYLNATNRKWVWELSWILFYALVRYKERLHTKYVKGLKPTDTSQHLAGKNWMFVKDGLDDFRDGLPPAVEGSDFIKVCDKVLG